MALPLLHIRFVIAGIGLFASLAGDAWGQGTPRHQPAPRLPSAAAVAARTAPPAEPIWEDEAPRARPAPTTTFRTLCVRLCDGFYFPVSFQTTRQGLDADAARCQAKCGRGAQLFFHANPGGNVASARSFTGLHYESLPNAFRHLKARVPGCGCTPEPWTVSEQERHRAYAEKERAAEAAGLKVEPPAADVVDENQRPLVALRRRLNDGQVRVVKDISAEMPSAPAHEAQPAPRHLDLPGNIARN